MCRSQSSVTSSGWSSRASTTRPQPGEIVHALETWEEPAGGGAVAAVQLANLAGSCLFFTALADDELGRRSREELEAHGVTVHASHAPGAQRRALTHVDEDGERTITVLGDKLRPSGEDGSLPWEELHRCDAVYFVSGDIAALRAARHSSRPRRDVSRARDAAPRRPCRWTCSSGAGRTPPSGSRPASSSPSRRSSSRPPATSVAGSAPAARSAPHRFPGRSSDAYGCGDCFAAGLTYGLALGKPVDEAVALGAQCGAAVLTGRGAYGHYLADPG